MVVARAWMEGEIRNCLMGIEFQFWKMEQSSRYWLLNNINNT